MEYSVARCDQMKRSAHLACKVHLVSLVSLTWKAHYDVGKKNPFDSWVSELVEMFDRHFQEYLANHFKYKNRSLNTNDSDWLTAVE